MKIPLAFLLLNVAAKMSFGAVYIDDAYGDDYVVDDYYDDYPDDAYGDRYDLPPVPYSDSDDCSSERYKIRRLERRISEIANKYKGKY